MKGKPSLTIAVCAWLCAAAGVLPAVAAHTNVFSLQQCFELALKRNLDVRIERATTDVARFGLGAAYGAYDPVLSIEASHAYIDAPGERTLTYRTAGLPSTAWARTRTGETLSRQHGLHAESIADVRTGDAILRFSARTVAAFAAKLAALDAGVHGAFEHATVLAGGETLRSSIDAWGPEPTTIATMRAIKAHFDPAGIMSPGRYVGAI